MSNYKYENPVMGTNRRNFLKKTVSVGMLYSASCISLAIQDSTSSLREPKRSNPPNVLWLIAEDLGKDLSCYGDTTIETPNIDSLAREGTRFNNAFCSSPICSPSRSSFNTGMYAASISAHNHRTAKDNKKRLPNNVKTITQLFDQAGYHTCLMGNPKEDFNFLANGKTYHSRDWSNRKKNQPFFAIYNFVEPHRWGWSKWEELPTHIDTAKIKLPPVYPDMPVMRQSFGQYYDFIVELDRKVGQILKKLKNDGLIDNTIIFFFGDNGRTMYRGKQWLYDEGLSVPLIVRFPRFFKKGGIRNDLVSLVDMAPSSLDLAGLEIPNVMQGQSFAGPNSQKREYIFASRDLCDTTRDTMRCVRDKHFKYIRNYSGGGYDVCNYTKLNHPEWAIAKEWHKAGRLSREQALMFALKKPKEELYDIKADPYETMNLVGNDKYNKILNHLRCKLENWLDEIHDVVLSDNINTT